MIARAAAERCAARRALAFLSHKNRPVPYLPPKLIPHGVSPPGERKRHYEKARGTARDRGYDAAWERAKAAHLAAHPACVYCGLRGASTTATLVDHFWPVRVYGPALFWKREFWVSSCASCHSGFKQSFERAGHASLCSLARHLGLAIVEPPRR